MNTKIITDMDGFRSIQEDWERLEQQDPDSTYYSTFKFNYSWWKTYGKDERKELFIVCCYRENKMVGIAPLMIRRVNKIVTCNTLCFLGKGDYFSFLIDREGQTELKIVKAIFGAIDHHCEKWDKIELTHMAQDTQLLYYLLRHDKYNEHVDYLTSCPIINLKDYGSFEHFSKSVAFTKLKKTKEKFRKAVNYQFKVIIGDQKEDIYQRVSQVHRLQKEYLQTQKGRSERQSLFEDKWNEDFLKRFLKENSQVVTFLLEDEAGEIIIYSISYLHKGIFYDWNSGYSPEYSHFHSLSNVLMMETIQYLYEQSLGDQIDCGAGSYAWKFKWTKQFKVNYSFKMWNMSKNKVKLYRFLSGARGMFIIALNDVNGVMMFNKMDEVKEYIF